MTTLGDLARMGVLEFSDGYRTRRDQHASEGFRILRAGDVRDGRVYPDGPDFVAHTFAPAIGAKAARVGDVVLTTKGTVGRTGMVGSLDGEVVYSPQICYFRVRRAETVDPRFLLHWMSSPEFVDQAGYLKSSTDMAPYISLKDLGSTQISLPTPAAQRAIAEVLGALDDKIAANQKVATVAEALFTAEFTGLQRSVEAELVAVTELVEVNPRSAAPTKPDPVYVDMQKLPTSGSQIAGWTTRPAQGGARFANGDTLMARITPCLENRKVGFVDFLEPGETAIGSTEFIVLRSRPGFAKPLSFLLAIDEGFRAHAVQHMVGSSGRQRVSASDLAAYELRLPLRSDALARLGERAESTFQLLASQRDESLRLAELRDTLLPHLMSGRLSVRQAEAQVEAVL